MPFTKVVAEFPAFGAASAGVPLPVASATAVNGTAFATFVRSCLRDSFSMCAVLP